MDRRVLIRALLISIVGLLTVYRVIYCVDREFVFDVIINIPLEIVAIFLIFWNLIRDRKQYKQDNNLTSFAPSVIGCSLCLLLFCILIILQRRDNSKTILRIVSKQVDFNGVSIDFRQDSTYKLTNWCLGAEYSRGKYSVKDSIITLDGASVKELIGNNNLVIIPDKVSTMDSIDKTSVKYSVYQIDKNGNVKNNELAFDVRP